MTPTKTNAQTPSPIVFIYDASGSMWGQMQGKTKVEIAREVLSNTVNELPAYQTIGLVAYGHREKGNCKDVETLVTLDNISKEKVTQSINAIKPLGKTPLAYSASLVIDDLRKSKQKATIILITDGIESCDGNICDLVTAAKAEGIDFKLHIVGFGLKEGETEQLKCAAKAGDGNYYDASDASALGSGLEEAVGQSVDKPKGNITFYAVKNGEPVDAYIKAYDQISKRVPIGVRTYRDTATVFLPPSTYRLEARPGEGSQMNPIIIEGIQSFEDKIAHYDISFDGGKFMVTTTNNEEGWDCTVNVFDTEGKRVGGTRTYGRTKAIEIDPGTYNIKIQALRMQGLATNVVLENKIITAGEETEVNFNFESGILNIYPKYNGELIDCTSKVTEVKSGERVAGGRTYNKGNTYVINPGTYTIEVNAIGEHRALGKKSMTITVNKGETKDANFQF